MIATNVQSGQAMISMADIGSYEAVISQVGSLPTCRTMWGAQLAITSATVPPKTVLADGRALVASNRTTISIEQRTMTTSEVTNQSGNQGASHSSRIRIASNTATSVRPVARRVASMDRGGLDAEGSRGASISDLKDFRFQISDFRNRFKTAISEI
jgi:hypothetical protein